MEKGIVIIIPAYNPDEKFIKFVDDLTKDGWKDIVVVDDGSKESSQPLLRESMDKYGCQLVKHSVNLGQGRAFKSGFNYFIGKYGHDSEIVGVVECDCDGQHTLEDVNRCARKLKENPDKFILGVRNFNDKGIPFRSRFGNKTTNFVFKLFCGLDINDTQTGLKGIPTSFIYKLIEVPGERFEYASGVLLATKDFGVDIIQLPISTIYLDGNATSHFNPVRDSIRIYSLIFKHMKGSFWAVVFELLAFWMIINLLGVEIVTIITAGIIAKVLSGSICYLSYKGKIVKYLGWCILHTTVSVACILLMTNILSINVFGAKVLVELALFILAYIVRDIMRKNNETI